MTEEALNELNRKIAVMQSSRAQKIQFRVYHGGEWININSEEGPSWDWIHYDYRVRAVEPRIVFVHTNCDGSVSTRHTSECPACPSIPFVEMTPEVRAKLNL